MRKIQDFTPLEMTEAIDAHFGEVFRVLLRGVPETSWYEEPGLTRHVSGLAHPFGNVVWGGNFTPESLDSRIAELLAPIVERDVPAFWIVGATARPHDLGKRLVAAGFVLGSEATGMALDISSYISPEPPEGVAVREVRSDDELAVWIEILSKGYGIPHPVCALFAHYASCHGYSSSVRYFLGYHQETPVSCSMIVLTEEIAGIYCVATLEEARGKGVGRAVTAFASTVASEQGYKLAVLQASAAGYPVYRKLGFQDYGTFTFYLRTAS